MTSQTFDQLLESIAAKTPTPGGGAVASMTAALAAALGRMVLNFSFGKKSLAAHDSLHHESLQKLATLGNRAIELADADAKAYGILNELWKLDKANPRRQREFLTAVQSAIAAPKAVLECSLTMLSVLNQLYGKTSAMLNSDLAIAAILADAAARSAAWNVRINLPLLDDAQVRSGLEADLERMLGESHQTCQSIEKACLAKLASGG